MLLDAAARQQRLSAPPSLLTIITGRAQCRLQPPEIYSVDAAAGESEAKAAQRFASAREHIESRRGSGQPKPRWPLILSDLGFLVEVTGLEPATSTMRT